MANDERKGEPKGDCFFAAFNHLMDVGVGDPDGERFTLIHGNLVHLPQDSEVNHAWVEEGSIVHEVSNGQNLKITKLKYYDQFGVTKERRYSVIDAMRENGQHGHYGPWDEPT